MRYEAAIRLARNPWLAAWLVVMLFGRMLIPTGFMPASGGMVLCSGVLAVPAGMDAPGQETSGICPFAAAAATLAMPHAVIVASLAHLLLTTDEFP